LLTIYVTDLDEYFRERVDRHSILGFLEQHVPSFAEVPPAETLLQVSGLARRSMKIEVIAATNE
jgi:enamine deaminase RidA (YjgF/YER057c/UK114 family)